MVNEDKRVQIQVAPLVILGLLWLARGLFEKSVVSMVFGASLMFASISLVLTVYVRSDSKNKRVIEIISGAAALGAIIYGYVVSGDLTLMIATMLISALLALAFILSYILPRISSKIS
jgi:phosphotransferase system  glucose/maltose/N-acetylglucosamine-specific IIC component